MSAPCCPQTSWPYLTAPEEYKAQGEESKLGDLPVYTVGKGDKGIIVLPEVWGWAGRLKGICDSLAAEGYYVVMPDCHRGTTPAKDFSNFGPWVDSYPWDPIIKQDFQALMKHLESAGVKRVGAIGFCWGVWALSKASSEGVPLVCGVGPHPSTKLEAMIQKGNEVEMMKKIKMPILLCPAGDDGPEVKTGGAVCDLVKAKGGDSISFPDMKHGWMTRGDLKDETVKRDVEACMAKALAFFKSNL